MNADKIKELAKYYVQFMEYTYRKDGTAYIHVKVDTPKELERLIYEIHQSFDAFPNDWIYNEIARYFEELELDCMENISPEADTYYHDQKKWFFEPFAVMCCDEASEHLGNRADSVMDRISCGQWWARDTILHAIYNFLEERAEVQNVL